MQQIDFIGSDDPTDILVTQIRLGKRTRLVSIRTDKLFNYRVQTTGADPYDKGFDDFKEAKEMHDSIIRAETHGVCARTRVLVDKRI